MKNAKYVVILGVVLGLVISRTLSHYIINSQMIVGAMALLVTVVGIVNQIRKKNYVAARFLSLIGMPLVLSVIGLFINNLVLVITGLFLTLIISALTIVALPRLKKKGLFGFSATKN